MRNKLIAVALSAAVTLPAASVFAKENLDVVSTFPKDMMFLGEGLIHFAKVAGEISNGDLNFTIHGAGDMVPALEVFSAVSQGSVPVGYDWMGYWGGRIPVANLAGALPFGPSPEVAVDWMWEGGGREIVQSAYDKHNIKFLPCVVVAAEPAGWFRKEMNTPKDFDGLRMRIGGLGGLVVSKLGASPQVIPGGEVYVSLDRGRIDAAEFSLPAIDESLQLYKAADYYYFPGWHQPSSFNSVLINMDVWNEFSETQQSQLEAACRSTVVWSLTNAVQNQADALERMEAEGTKVRRFSDEILTALEEATDQVIADEMEKDETFKRAYESLEAHMERSERWNELQSLK